MKRSETESEAEEPPRKRAKGEAEEECDVILLDIEGTTTPISFVHERLFPFASAQAEAHLEAVWHTDQGQSDALALAAEMGLPEAGDGGPRPLPRTLVPVVAAEVRRQIAADQKTRPLKDLQGRIWARGYESGELKGELFEDVHPCLESWARRGRRVCIYSSGSVPAQRLLFGHTPAGDLLHLLGGHYDTRVGHKRERASYEAIAADLGVAAARVLFVTDVLAEAQAAREAGMAAALSVRPGNAPVPEGHGFPEVRSLVDLRL